MIINSEGSLSQFSMEINTTENCLPYGTINNIIIDSAKVLMYIELYNDP